MSDLGRAIPGNQSTDQALSRFGYGILPFDVLQNVGQGGQAEERHANRLQGVGSMNRINRYHIGVLKLGQRPRFVIVTRRHFQNDRTVGQFSLHGQKDSGKSASADFFDESETDELRSNFGEGNRGLRQSMGSPRVGSVNFL